MGENFLRLHLTRGSFFQPRNECSLWSHKEHNLLAVVAITSHLCRRSSSSGDRVKLSITHVFVIPAVTVIVKSEYNRFLVLFFSVAHLMANSDLNWRKSYFGLSELIRVFTHFVMKMLMCLAMRYHCRSCWVCYYVIYIPYYLPKVKINKK